MAKERLDVIVQNRLQITRSKAQGLIQTGCVTDANGTVLTKPGIRLEMDVPLQIRQREGFVSRGGDKLNFALESFGVSVTGKIAIDVGASTGGFTDCLLRRGVAKVYAVDVGYGQLDWTLRQDPRVIVLERCNIRNLSPDQLPERPDFFTVDCSFISLTLVLPALIRLLREKPEGIVLIKPQFEAGRNQVGRGGVVHDPNVHQQVIEAIATCAHSLGFKHFTCIPSPLLGPAGNTEFLALLKDYSPSHSEAG